MAKYIYTFIVAAIIIMLNVLWGSVISWFLSLSIIAILVFFVVQLQLEDIVNNLLKKKSKDISQNPRIGHQLFLFGKKWESILKFALLSVVFILGVWCIKTTTDPMGKNTWLLNNDYHGISNTGITFDNKLALRSTSTDSNAQIGNIIINTANEDKATILFKQFYIPAFITLENRKHALLNNILPQNITQSFSLQNTDFEVTISVKEKNVSFINKIFTDKQNRLLFDIQLIAKNNEMLSQWNLQAPFQDKIHIETSEINIGKKLFELLLNAHTFESEKEESYQVLEAMLQELGDSYFLAHFENDKKYYRLFPGKNVFDNNYSILIDNQKITPQLSNSTSIDLDKKFYIGFANHRKQLYISKNNKLNTTDLNYALIFDYPNTYLLKSPGKQQAGNKNIRFVTNDFEQIIENDLKEGFLFNNYQLTTASTINGSIDYYAGQPNTALALYFTDYNTSTANTQVSEQQFSLITKDRKHQYLFQLRDFSENGFSTEKSVLYLSIIFLSFIILQVLYPGKKLERIEPIILTVIMILTVLRFLLYWRVATFPPLENISKYELEKTLLQFDFNIGIQLPIPLTLIWIVGMVAVIILYRIGKQKNKIPDVSIIWQKISPKRKSYNIQYIVLLGACLVLFMLNKKILHIEILTRIVSILLPIIAYVIFSGKANAQYEYQSKQLLYGGKKKWLEHFHAYLYYYFNNPTTFITLTTLAFFAITDRGFAILFFLFLLLKNILINFLKKPLANTKISIANRLFAAPNFWIYGLLSLAIYLTLLSIKPIFYYLLTYKVWVLFAILLLTTIVLKALIQNKKISNTFVILSIIIGVITIIPATNKWLDKQMSDVVKHVQYRASIIYQPIHELLQANEYTSFKTQKIIETAENQWFINSYISKPYDNSETINLRAHSRIGVDYSTQTRDVVLARYVISEWGNLTMYLILIIMALPMILYLLAYRFTLVTQQSSERDTDSYTGLIPLLIMFTIALFVWLTATNRFVFFGQDFPFLSLTSKLSVLMPLMLWAITLMQQPTPKHSFQVDVKNSSIRYIIFMALIAIFALTTVKENELNNDNFSIVMENTKEYVEKDLNAILTNIQDELEAKKEKITYNKIINKLANDSSFVTLKNDVVKDNYTKSILDNLIQKPATAFQLNNPLFMIYDNGRYNAVYNKNLYLELPPIESRKIWQGNIIETIQNNSATTALLRINKDKKHIQLPYITHNPIANYQFGIIPKHWIRGAQDNVGILNIINANSNNTSVFVYKNTQKNMTQNATSFATTLQYDDLATIYQNNNTHQLGFHSEGNKFATNKWINGNYKIIYPLRADNFWIYSYANAIRNAYSNDSCLLTNSYITLDYNLSATVNKAIQSSVNNSFGKRNPNFNFSVIAADGNGHIRLMNDYVSNRKTIDPNDHNTIFALQRQHFFYSNAKNERDQWGNKNLLNLYLGPGSSIKSLTAAVVASQVNAGWENIRFAPPGSDRGNFAGLKLIKPWKNDEHYFGSLDIPAFIAHSSNYYHALFMFLGSYTKDDFNQNNTYSLRNVLSTEAGKNNNFPIVNFHNQNYYFKNFNDKAWPLTDKSATHKSYFGNENSLIANGFEINVGLRTKDKDKLDKIATTNDRVNFVDPHLSTMLSNNKNSGYLWSFPEQSYFLQSERAHTERHQNFNLGVMTASLGGYPFRITPYKMAEMYLSLFTQNNNLQLSIVPQQLSKSDWNIDVSWQNNFQKFLASNIFEGMKQVITNGTARRLQSITSKYNNYFFYAKTGTINEQASGNKSSRRLILTITDKDLTQAENIGKTKVYVLYFVSDNTQDFDWNLVYDIIHQTIASQSFQHYFGKL